MQQQEGELRRRGPLTRSRKARMLTQQDAKPASRTALADLSNANNRTDATKKKKKLTQKEAQSLRRRATKRSDSASVSRAPDLLRSFKRPNSVSRAAICEVVDVESDDPVPPVARSFVFSEIDVDREDEDVGFADYCNDIYENMRSNELKHHVCADYIKDESRTDVSHSMRAVLIDWLVEVCDEYSLAPQTLFLTINLVDAFLRQNNISRKLLQLLGVSCMLIASKYEEIHPPTAAEFSYITDYTFTTREVVQTEETVLTQLHFQVARATSWEFRRRFVLALDNDPTSLSLISYILELSLQFPLVLRYLPSIVSAAATSLALLSLNKPQWTRELIQNTGYQYSEVRPCVVELHEMMQMVSKLSASKTKAVTDKYRKRCHHFVGNLEPPNFIP